MDSMIARYGRLRQLAKISRIDTAGLSVDANFQEIDDGFEHGSIDLRTEIRVDLSRFAGEKRRLEIRDIADRAGRFLKLLA